MRDDQAGEVRVWDLVVRLAHWPLVVAVVATWFTRHAGAWHEWIGYFALAVVAMRVIWGFVATGHARFADFVYSPSATSRYAGQLIRRSEPRYLGHNPLGGWMVVFLLGGVLLSGLTGWLYTTDRFWGIEWVETLHRWSAYALYGLAGLHLAGVVFTSLRHGENLVLAMITGRKRAQP
ncbi:MAG: cytochrome b/b6 domain-containing protein [Burkholderiales bacterium]